MQTDSNQPKQEREFHQGEGHEVPFFIKLAWSVFIIAGIVYLVKFSYPDLLVWLKK
jgi:hypothetical protein